MANNQRKGAESNSAVGKDFKSKVINALVREGYEIESGYSLNIGVSNIKKEHKFAFGGTDQFGARFVAECKSHTWTESGNIPSAKIATWVQCMYYFSMVDSDYLKYFVVLKDRSDW